MKTLSINQATQLAQAALQRNNTSAENAQSVAAALVQAEIEGQKGHGLSRLITYAPQAKNGKVNGQAQATVAKITDAMHRVDAHFGFAFPAIDLAIQVMNQHIQSTGVCLVGIVHSHHFGQAARICEKLCENNLISLVFGNAPKAMTIPPAKVPLLGTNPIAFGAPTPDQPLLIDMALSTVARGKIVVAEQKGEKIPLDWATDVHGNPTDDPTAAIAGMVQPVGGTKGALLALMVEIMAAALTNSCFATEASSLLNAEGPPPDLGQCIIAIDAQRFNPHFLTRMQHLCTQLTDNNVHIPGSSKPARHAHAAQHGIQIDDTLHTNILNL